MLWISQMNNPDLIVSKDCYTGLDYVSSYLMKVRIGSYKELENIFMWVNFDTYVFLVYVCFICLYLAKPLLVYQNNVLNLNVTSQIISCF